MKPRLFKILFLFGILTSLSFVSASSLDLRSYFSPGGGAQGAIIDAIFEATQTIDVAMYSFSSDRILEAFERLKRGKPHVRIRMIFNDADNDVPKEEGAKPSAERAYEIERAGIDVRYVTRGNGRIMHEKFMIVDGVILLNGSGNFSDSSDSRYDENLIEHRFEETKDDDLISAFQQEFDLMWRYSYDFPKGSTFREERQESRYQPNRNADSVAYFTSSNFDLGYTFPKNGEYVVSEALAEAIKNAKSSIYVATGHFRLMLLANALIRAKKQKPGLDIRVVLDNQEYVSEARHGEHMRRYRRCISRFGEGAEECEFSGGYELSRYLSENGIDVRLKYYTFLWYYPFEPQMHHKYMIVDEREVWTGSYNWSRNAELNSFENVVHYRADAGLVSEFLKNFEKLWKLHRDQYAERQQELREKNRIEIHFGGKRGEGAMALSISEIDRLIDILEEEAPRFFEEARAEDRYFDKRREEGSE